ncbi:MAG: pyridoxamine 5'-phosphate oxidase family protein [Candidatus Brocadia sp. AMX2]|uniref:Pyridoxamine 5'-phosphate oxidase-related FMN-binding protein n=1 Tax=Candidatus Brocadia sinica JPN1 TaxID=1197129 RepID=A0ABQ0K2D1_9BACT|nr:MULTISPECIES: pyridoxamine 5'-phosphate oxidase family protein [Brocadia]KXK25680.1 MAG: FMN-binding protein [Candidatus Brocadia sinica]MBC6932683.1 pyridoxamine 5'-phosphate oxidase family protein [Candidatus Brocadia sp.]MBL1169575.1 pyridoxamine 5'-phosphate oxidase family protein [Candidatus Brocadia sp. AMX1]NOG42993.1 pyridoxamine 5'-phosphate oxidase family protein [Planctomycetota bacterium]KAA0243886.1 MAG: pyridoxamine 5'-phosphate oxidase family protein [Candidatus Brocadia sp. 
MIPDKMLEILKYEGVVAIATMGGDGPHMVNTWNSYIVVTQDGHLLLPVGGMIRTEANVGKNNNILLTLGSREVEGFHGPGAGFLIKGTAVFIKSGEQFDIVKKRFSWARAAMEITILSATQTL